MRVDDFHSQKSAYDPSTAFLEAFHRKGMREDHERLESKIESLMAGCTEICKVRPPCTRAAAR